MDSVFYCRPHYSIDTNMTHTNFTVLVVDDDQDDLELFCETIQAINSSIDCLIANNGDAALSLLNQLLILPNIIFLDFNMPQMNGGVCLAEIRKSERLKNIPVVMYSTFFSEKSRNEFKQAGAFLIQKQNEIKTVIQSILSGLRHFYPDLMSNV